MKEISSKVETKFIEISNKLKLVATENKRLIKNAPPFSKGSQGVSAFDLEFCKILETGMAVIIPILKAGG